MFADMIDIREYSENELSLRVMNDNNLYELAIKRPKDLRYKICLLYEFTEKQWEVLCDDVNEVWFQR
jgi:hypothetical protein